MKMMMVAMVVMVVMVAAQAATITYDSIPVMGDPSKEYLDGTTSGVDNNQYGVATWLKGQDGNWYTKPNSGIITPIEADGSFSVYVITSPNDLTAKEFYSEVVPLSATLPDCWPTLCPTRPTVAGQIASIDHQRPYGVSPRVILTHVPVNSNPADLILQGRVEQVNNDLYGITVYVMGENDQWWPRPDPSVLIYFWNDGTFEVQIRGNSDDTPSEVVVMAIPNEAEIPECYPESCLRLPDIPGTVAQATATIKETALSSLSVPWFVEN